MRENNCCSIVGFGILSTGVYGFSEAASNDFYLGLETNLVLFSLTVRIKDLFYFFHCWRTSESVWG